MASPKARLCIVEFTAWGSIGNKMKRRFCKPKSDEPTRFLFVGNCGPAKGLQQEDVERLFAPFGEVEVELGEVEKSYVLVTYQESTQAEAAVRHFTEVDASRQFMIRYADVKPPKQSVKTSSELDRS